MVELMVAGVLIVVGALGDGRLWKYCEIHSVWEIKNLGIKPMPRTSTNPQQKNYYRVLVTTAPLFDVRFLRRFPTTTVFSLRKIFWKAESHSRDIPMLKWPKRSRIYNDTCSNVIGQRD